MCFAQGHNAVTPVRLELDTGSKDQNPSGKNVPHIENLEFMHQLMTTTNYHWVLIKKGG